MSIFSDFIVIVGRQRSGTTVLRKMLSSGEGVVDLGEIFHKDFGQSQDNFFYFLKQQIEVNSQLLHPVTHRELFKDYLKQIHLKYKPNKLLLDIKYNAFDMIRGFDPVYPATPFLVNFIKNNGIKVFHVERKNKLKVIVSERLAIKTGKWEVKLEEQDSNVTKIYIDTSSLKLDLHFEQNLSNLYKQYFCDHSSYYNFVYEEMFDQSGDFHKFLIRRVQSTVGPKISFDSKPKLKKQNTKLLIDTIENFDEVVKALKNSRFETYLDIQLVSSKYGKFYCLKNDIITNQLISYGAHVRNELAMLLNFVKEGDTVIDVGSHIGTFTIPFAVKVGKAGQVFAFEANPRTYSLLEKNVKANNCSDIIQTNNAIVTDTPGNYSLKQEFQNNTGGSYFYLDSQKIDSESEQNNCVLLDAWYENKANLKKVDVIKIDTEGSELNVLRSAKKIIENYNPVIYLEVNTKALTRAETSREDIELFLRELGYHFFKNTGERNSNNDKYVISELDALKDGGEFYDLLAVHAQSAVYPTTYSTTKK